MSEQNGKLIIQAGSIRDGKSKNIAFLLDIDFIVQKTDQAIPLESASNVIEAAHEQVENAFEACITDNARTLFKGKVPEWIKILLKRWMRAPCPRLPAERI